MAEIIPLSSRTDGAGAQARAESLARLGMVRPADPVRQRFPLEDESKTRARQTQDGQSPLADDGAGERSKGFTGGLGSGLLGAFTSFLARFMGQAETGGQSTVPSAITQGTGIDAYARANDLVGNDQDQGPDLLTPGLPRLSSGRALDLSV